MYLGKNKHILTAPLQHGKVINIVAFSSDRTVSSQDPVWSNADWIVPGTAEEMMEGWEDWSEDVGQIVRVSLARKTVELDMKDLLTNCLFSLSRSPTSGLCTSYAIFQRMRSDPSV